MLMDVNEWIITVNIINYNSYISYIYHGYQR